MERRTKFIIVAIIIALCVIAGVAVYQNIITRWIVRSPNSTPEISLNVPADSTTINASTLFFNWTSSDYDDDVLEHEWFIDLYPTMNSPEKTTHNTGEGTNHSPASLLDGTWYWKVEVSDGIVVNSSETRRVFMNEYPSNHIPDILNYSLTDIIGGTESIFYYLMTYQDIDNDSPSAVKVYIDSISYNMLEVDSEDSNYSDGKDYYYQTKLSLGVHNYSFYASDGVSVNITSVFEGPIVVPQYNTLPEITLISPSPGEIFNTINVTFLWDITDAEDNLDYYELWLWKGSNPKQVYSVPNGTTLQLTADTYHWQILAVDEYGQNTSEKRSFGVLATGKQCSVTIQADDTSKKTGESFTGDLVITNEGPLESYEVYWYVELWNKKKTKWYTSDVGSVAVTTTVTVSFKVPVDEDLDGGTYYLRAFAYDSSADNGTLIGQDELKVTIKVKTILYQDMIIVWHSLIYDTPRYVIDLDKYPKATQVKIPLTYNYSFFLFSGTRALKELELYLYSGLSFIQIPTVMVSIGVYSFGEVGQKGMKLVVVPNPSITDCTWLYNLLHDDDI